MITTLLAMIFYENNTEHMVFDWLHGKRILILLESISEVLISKKCEIMT